MLHEYEVKTRPVHLAQYKPGEQKILVQFEVYENNRLISTEERRVSVEMILNARDRAQKLTDEVHYIVLELKEKYISLDYARERSEIIAEFIKQLQSSATFNIEDGGVVLQVTIKDAANTIIEILKRKGDKSDYQDKAPL